MNKLLLPALVLLSAAVSCGAPPPAALPTVAPTAVPLPTSTVTPPPTPTETPVPSPTPIAYPAVLDQTFSGVNVLYQDDFKYHIRGLSPEGWETAQDAATLRVIEGGWFKITPRPKSSGDTFYYTGQPIRPGQGVSLLFQYMGTKDTFTWGIDNINAQGRFFRFKSEGYYSFAMQMLGPSLSAHVIEGPYLKDDDFKGTLKLLEGTWYGLLIAFDKQDNYIIKIWNPEAPGDELVYVRNWPNSPTSYYFISWIGAGRTLLVDDFTIFGFDELSQE